jgi:UDP-glucose 4-epimerase
LLIIDNLSTGKPENLLPEIPFINADILETCAARAIQEFKPEAILHLAAKVSVRGSVDGIADDARQNFLGTACVLEAACAAGVKRFVMASSMAVYADAPSPIPLNEIWPSAPRSPYGISKLAAEQLLHQTGQRTGMTTAALRLFNAFGPGQALSPYVGVVTIFINRLLSGEAPMIFGDGEQCRDFVHVADIARACRLALESSCSGQSINIGTARGTTVNQLAKMLIDNVAPSLKAVHVGTRPEENRNSVADIGLARDLLGYSPQHSLEEKLTELIEAHLTAPTSQSFL